MIEQRLQAIESTLAIATAEEKMRVIAYLQEMHALTRNFAAEPHTTEGVPSGDGSASSSVASETTPAETQGDHSRVPVRYAIPDGATGYIYERIFRPYIDGAEQIVVEDPYIRKPYQVDNFARFCALAVRLGAAKAITLKTGTAFGEDLDEADSRLETLRRDLKTRGIELKFTRTEKLHDREVQFSNGWIVKVGRRLDIYYPPESRITVDAEDFSLRRCRQTKIEAFAHDHAGPATGLE
jgi:ATP-dependent Lon protease